MAKKDTRRKYNKEFKLKVVREHVEGASLTELSKIYDIAPSTLGTWFANMIELGRYYRKFTIGLN